MPERAIQSTSASSAGLPPRRADSWLIIATITHGRPSRSGTRPARATTLRSVPVFTRAQPVAGLSFSRLRMLRQWAGIVDVVQDSSPIIGETPVPGLYINCGWGTGGFKAIPVGGWTLAHVLATCRNHELAEPFQLARFETGRLIDEAAAAGIAH